MILCKSYPCAIWKLFYLTLNMYVKFYVKRDVIFVMKFEPVRKYRTGRYMYRYRVFILLLILKIPTLRFALSLRPAKILVPSSCLLYLFIARSSKNFVLSNFTPRFCLYFEKRIFLISCSNHSQYNEPFLFLSRYII